MDKPKEENCKPEERRKSIIHSFCNKIYTAHIMSPST